MTSNSLGSPFLLLPLPVFQQHFPKHLEQLSALQMEVLLWGEVWAHTNPPALCLAQLNISETLEAFSSCHLEAWGSPLARWAAFPPSKSWLWWLKVEGMGRVSQEWCCCSAPVCLQLSPFSRSSWRSPGASVSEARPWPSIDLCRDLSASLQPWPGGNGFNSYSKCIYSKQTPLAGCCLMHIPAAPTVHLIKIKCD